jgi:hypothetical protein
VDLHLEAVPGLGTLTTWGLTGGDLKDLGGETDGALDTEVLVLGTVDEVSADCTMSATITRLTNYAHFSRFLTFLEVRVILILWILAAGAPVFSKSSLEAILID